MSGEPKAAMSITVDYDVAAAVRKLADSRRQSVSEMTNRLLKERLRAMVLEAEAEAIQDVVKLEAGTPIGKLKAWIAERNKAGLMTSAEEIAAKKAEFEAEGAAHA